MTIDAQPHRGPRRIPEQMDAVGTMRIVTTSAIKPLARPCRIFEVLLLFLRDSEGVPHGPNTGDRMGGLPDIRVTIETYKGRILPQQRHLFGRMRPMAAQTHARGDRRMDILFRKCLLAVAGVTKTGRSVDEEFLVL